MPVDPSISLNAGAPNLLQSLGQWGQLGMLGTQLGLQRNALQVSNATVPAQIAQAQAQAGSAQQKFSQDQLQTLQMHAGNAIQGLGTLYNDADLSSSKITDFVNTMTKNTGAPPAAAAQVLQTLPQNTDDPAILKPWIANRMASILAADSQFGKTAGAVTPTQTTGGTAFPNVANPALGAAPQPTIPPPNVLGAKDVYGNPVITNTASATSQPITGAPGGGQPPPQMSLPPGETPENLAAMQSQRIAATAAAGGVGLQHNLNQAIYNLANGGLTTGKMGAGLTWIQSLLGHPLNAAGDHAADYNTLGKYLARSTAAGVQAMNLPNTNAGATLSAEASGTTDYDPATLKRISILNEGVAQGTTLFQQGIENAIKTGGPNAIGAARNFTAQWGSTFDPTAMALMAAVKSGNKSMQDMILKQAGGANSPGAQKLRATVHSLYELAGQQ